MTNPSINIQTPITAESIADSCNYEQALELIKLVDSAQVSYEFTEEVAFYLLKECLKCFEGEVTEIKEFKAKVGKLFKNYE